MRFESRKWPDSPHWQFDALRLGADGHGHWIGIPKGTWLERPGAGFHATADHVTLVPYDAWWVATFYGTDRERPVDVYVDIATPADWHEDDLVRCVDLDLDVVLGTGGRVWVDDEDEFAHHRVALGYPAEVSANALASCEEVFAALRDRRAPYDGTAARWIEALATIREGRDG